MKFNALILATLLSFTAGGGLAYLMPETEDVMDNMPGSCTANFSLFLKNTRLDIIVVFLGDPMRDQGVVINSGTYIVDGKAVGTINRQTTFSYSHYKNNYYLTSKTVRKIKDETLPEDMLAYILPDFYLYPDKLITYNIEKLKDSEHYLFSVGKLPRFICES